MKRNILFFCAMLSFSCAFSQVGVNTQNPQGVFNVDGAKDNLGTGSPSAKQQLNDFTVTNSGNVGIGTTSPKRKLDINTGGTSDNPIPGFKLNDGSQKPGLVLTTDSKGVGTWQRVISGLTLIIGHLNEEGLGPRYYFQNTNELNSTHSYIDIPPGF